MVFSHRAAGKPNRLGVLPGTFNPVTVAHLALARAALEHVDEIVFVLPRVFPHKTYAGASFDQRVEMLRRAIGGHPAYSIATAERGLFIEISRECREVYGDQVRLAFLCGRDAAERIAAWDYGRPGAFLDMLHEFDLLVAPRGGVYDPPAEFAGAVKCLNVDSVDAVSATEVRDRIARGAPWEHLVPPAIRAAAFNIYR